MSVFRILLINVLCFYSLGLFARDLTITNEGTNERSISFTTGEPRRDTGDLKVTREDFTKLCQNYIDLYYDKLDLIEKSRINTATDRLKANPDYAADLSGSAVVASATATLEYMPIVMSALAALSDPVDPLLVNNFGAILRALHDADVKQISQGFDDPILIFIYAKTLEPHSPMILTNLGNAYIDLNMYPEAEENYRQAIKYDDYFCAAHEGMARVYVHKKDGRRAIDELIKAGKLGFSASMRKGFREAAKSGGHVESPFWEEDQQNEDQNENEKSQDDILKLPVFPKWVSRDAFMFSLPNLVEFSQAVMEKSMAGGLQFAATYHADELDEAINDFDSDPYPDEEGDSDGEDEDDNSEMESIESVELLPSYGQKLFMLELVNDYYTQKIEQEYNKNAARRKMADEIFQQELQNLKESGEYKQMMKYVQENDTYNSKRLAKDINKRASALADDHFIQWRDMTLDTYRGVKILLYEYWNVAYQVAGDMYDQDAVNYFNDIRELTVNISLLPIATDFSLLPPGYALADYFAPIVTKDEDLNQYKSSPVAEIEMLEKEVDDCPLKKIDKLVLNAGAIGFSITCDTWEIEYLQGIGGSLKRNFKNGDTEITVLVGVKAGVGGVSATAKEGISLKFNEAGDFTGWAVKSEVGAKVGMGPVSVGKSIGFSSDIGMVSSPKTTISFGGVGKETSN
ncbi:tetratricopeptide repeat protein [Petrimonas sulfuriphila]|uniref:tetratricopeptide repeat protein n=1 Tax=Petrimonas sulfuriphila TaxID=285070 RepID=UPI0032560491